MINYVVGDATQPEGDGMKFITHICNNVGAWGAGFVMALSERWTEPQESFLWWAGRGKKANYVLGRNQYVQVEEDIYVVNMVAQNGTISDDNPHPISYTHLALCLQNVAAASSMMNASVHMPRIGTGLAGGSWEEIEAIINDTLSDVSVTVYDLP